MTSQIVRLEPKPGAPAKFYENSRQWIITAPWAHPWWSQYAAFVHPLVSGMSRFKPGMTHEFMLYALDPARPPVIDETNTLKSFAPLTPPNMGYQFKAETNDEAVTRIQKLIDRIDAMTLSPDTDFRSSTWDPLFLPDGHSLVRSIFAPKEPQYEELIP